MFVPIGANGCKFFYAEQPHLPIAWQRGYEFASECCNKLDVVVLLTFVVFALNRKN